MSLKVFEGYGIEAEYMIIDNDDLSVRTYSEDCLRGLNGGELNDEVKYLETLVSNELVAHVIEIKCDGPKDNLLKIEDSFSKSILKLNEILSLKNASLLGTGMHPFMDPKKEMKLWPYGQKEIYDQYNKIFKCTGHGWSNLQSIHINLPYADESQFGRLHAAIRLVLPLFPYLCASSPICEGLINQFPDQRLKFYENNQRKIPSIVGDIIPERAFTFKKYDEIYERMYEDILPFDKEKILSYPWLNSRGAILKRDVGAIEIRLMDIQESPLCDFSLISFFIELIRAIYNEEFISYEEQKLVHEKHLKEVYFLANSYDEEELPSFYSKIFLCDFKNLKNLSSFLFSQIKGKMPERYQKTMEYILENGNLSRRMREFIKKESIRDLLLKLGDCVKNNEKF